MKKKLTFALAGIVAALTLGSIAWAAIPDTGGVIHGCYDKTSGALRVTDPQANVPKGCGIKETSLDWSQRTAPGPGDAFAGRFGNDTGNAAATSNTPCTLGQVLLTASTTKTAGGVPANGQLLAISQNAALFALLGTTYGGDGKVTFALPDLRAVAPNHMTYSVCTEGIWPS